MSALEEFARQYGYAFLFGGVLLENAGLPVPGETAVLISGFLASPAGGGHLHVLGVILVTFVAAVLGDNIGFWLGREWARPRLQNGRRFLFLTPKALQLAESYFDRYGVWTIFFARFITGLRVVGALAAGTAGMPWLRFLAANAGGALAWSVTMTLLGYFFGHSLDLLHKWLGRGALIVLACVVVLFVLPLLLSHLRKQRPEMWQRMVHGQIWVGMVAAILEVIFIGLLVWMARPDLEPDWPRDVDVQVRHRLRPFLLEMPYASVLVEFGRYAGSLPITAGVSLLLSLYLWRRGRRWQEVLAICGVLLVSEALGLILHGLLQHRGLHTPEGLPWPDNIVEVAPLRAFAVFGTAAYLLGREGRRGRMPLYGLAALLVLSVGWCSLLAYNHRLTKLLLEYAAGGVIVFTVIWWLEGYSGLWPGPHTQPTVDPANRPPADAPENPGRVPLPPLQR
jgi:membrane protein DedA with SNARE-associated domain